MTVSLELLSRGPARPDLLEDLVVTEAGLAAVLARWGVPAAVEVESAAGVPDVAAVAAVLAAGTPAVLDSAVFGSAVFGSAEAVHVLADILRATAHSGVGFGSGLIPRCSDAAQVWALLSGAVAAMTGADVSAALQAPDPAALVGLPRAAREAIRDVVTCVIVPGPELGAVLVAMAD